MAKYGDLSISEFDKDENEAFEKAWYYLTFSLNKEGPAPIFNRIDKEFVRYIAQAVKLDFDNIPFEGVNPKSGFGIRWINVYDVGEDVGFDDWDVTWGTAGYRNWITEGLPDAGTFDGQDAIYLKDSTDILWAIVMLGLVNHAPNPVGRALITELDEKPQALQYFDFQMRGTDMKIAKLQPVYVPLGGVVKLGLDIQPTGSDTPRPLGFTFAKGTRLRRQLADANRPTAL